MNENIRLDFLKKLDEIHQKYNRDNEPSFEFLKDIQKKQINLIEDILCVLIEECSDADDYVWEKASLIRAMSIIAHNKIRNRPENDVIPTYTWQTLPLVDIENALTQKDERSKQLSHLDKYKEFTLDELLSFCRSIAKIP